MAQNRDFFGHYFYLFTAFFWIPFWPVFSRLDQTPPRAVSEILIMTWFNPNKKFWICKSSWSKQAETRRMRYGIELITSKWEKRRKKGRFCSLWCPKLSKNMWEIHVSKIYWNQLSSQSWQILENFPKKRVISGYECGKWIGRLNWVYFVSGLGLNRVGFFLLKECQMPQDLWPNMSSGWLKRSWTTNFSRPYVTTINHLVWSFRSFQQVKLVCMLTLEYFFKDSPKVTYE